MFTDKVARGFYKNVHRSMNHDVILIQSIAFKNSRLPVMKEFFEITECEKVPFSFYKSNASDTFQVFRLKHKKNLSTGLPVGKSIVDESKCLKTHHAKRQWSNCHVACGKTLMKRRKIVRPRNASGTEKSIYSSEAQAKLKKSMYSCVRACACLGVLAFTTF